MEESARGRRKKQRGKKQRKNYAGHRKKNKKSKDIYDIHADVRKKQRGKATTTLRTHMNKMKTNGIRA
jgi:hypothetical protein